MNNALLAFLAITFGAQLIGVGALIWVIWRRQLDWSIKGALEIFAPGERGHPEAPAAQSGLDPRGVRESDHAELRFRAEADESSAPAVLAFVRSSVLWLLVGSVLGVVAALQMTFPDWLVQYAPVTFGRIRPMHLNAVVYGWVSTSGIAVSLWLLPRLLRTRLRGTQYARRGAFLWNIGVTLGLVSIAAGYSEGVEWLEFPWPADLFLVVAGAVVAIPLFLTLARRRTRHLYVSALYITAAFLWFPVLFLIGNLPKVHFGVEHAIANWWFAHNVLGLWLTPLGLAAAYYLIPKVLGRPIYSYGLSLLGFWSLALFYSQVGIHHLIGGPVPSWLVNLSIVTSVMMVVPVLAVAVNHHITLWRERSAAVVRRSWTLRFVVLGAMLYTVTSLEGSLQALRWFNQVTHFTHFTVAHAHLGVYGFVSFVMFGAIYFLLPRMMKREWPHPRLIAWHFWLATIGIAIYVIALSIGGWLQGSAMLDETRPFEESVRVTIPYLHARSVGGTLMLIAHALFGWHVWRMTRRSKTASSSEVSR